MSWTNPDLRPAFVLHDMLGARFIHACAQHADHVPTFLLKGVAKFSVDDSEGIPDAARDDLTDDSL